MTSKTPLYIRTGRDLYPLPRTYTVLKERKNPYIYIYCNYLNTSFICADSIHTRTVLTQRFKTVYFGPFVKKKLTSCPPHNHHFSRFAGQRIQLPIIEGNVGKTATGNFVFVSACTYICIIFHS